MLHFTPMWQEATRLWEGKPRIQEHRRIQLWGPQEAILARMSEVHVLAHKVLCATLSLHDLASPGGLSGTVQNQILGTT